MTSQLTDQTITFDGRAFINGERVAARSGAASTACRRWMAAC